MKPELSHRLSLLISPKVAAVTTLNLIIQISEAIPTPVASPTSPTTDLNKIKTAITTTTEVALHQPSDKFVTNVATQLKPVVFSKLRCPLSQWLIIPPWKNLLQDGLLIPEQAIM